jgi:AmmeMemoRadiSam system protein B/AmmeMemoRadiSam system protein A
MLKRVVVVGTSVFTFALLCVTWACYGDQAESRIRQPAVAGQFYPGDARHLAGAIEAFLNDAVTPLGKRPLILIAPHAGYIYSGQIAADAYKQASAHDYELIVVLGTNHTQPLFDGVSLYDGAGYHTPLGLAEIDRRTTAALLKAEKKFTFKPAVHQREHSVEVQIPFIQALFPDVKIVAAVVGSPDPELAALAGRALAKVLSGRKALIVASSDLSHYPGADDACAADGAILRAIASLDPDNVRSAAHEQMRLDRPGLSTCACGMGPILVAIDIAKRWDATAARVISYAHSGDAAVGSPDRVVGYGAVVFTPGAADSDVSALQPVEVADPKADLTPADKRAMLELARETIHRYLTTETTPLARGFAPALNRKQGAFVTLKKQGELRGCIGHMVEDRPLCQVIGAMALQAAFNDRRFQPLRWSEWEDIEIEISVLTPFERVASPEEIVVGRDGVLIKKSGHSAVFLPQVATEQGWGREEMLNHLCRKAGLPQDAWQGDTEFYTFQAEVFHENP